MCISNYSKANGVTPGESGSNEMSDPEMVGSQGKISRQSDQQQLTEEQEMQKDDDMEQEEEVSSIPNEHEVVKN